MRGGGGAQRDKKTKREPETKEERDRQKQTDGQQNKEKVRGREVLTVTDCLIICWPKPANHNMNK